MPRTYNFGVQVTDDIGATAQRMFSIDVNNSDYDRFAKATSLGIGRSKNGIDWQFDASTTNKGDYIYWVRDRWVLVDGIGSSQVLKQSFDLRSWETITVAASNALWSSICFKYVPETDRLYIATFDWSSQTVIEYIPNFSAVGNATTWPPLIAYPSGSLSGGYAVDMSINPVTGVVLVMFANTTVYRVTPTGTLTDLSSTQGIYGRTWQSNGVLVNFNARNGTLLFKLSFDDGLSWIDKSPTALTPPLYDGARPFAYINGVFAAHYRDASANQYTAYTTDLGDTWDVIGSGVAAPSELSDCIPLTYNNKTVMVDPSDIISVWSGNTASTFVGQTSFPHPAIGSATYGDYAAVRVEAL